MKPIQTKFMRVALALAIGFLSTLSFAQGRYGPVETKERPVSSFKGIKASGSVNVYIEKGGSEKVVVEADQDLHEQIITKVSGGVLEVSTKGTIRNPKVLKIYVTMSELTSLDLSGATDIYVEDNFSQASLDIETSGAVDLHIKRGVSPKDLYINSSGASDIEIMNLKTGKLEVKVTGSGDVYLAGSATSADLTLSGASDFEARNLDISNCKINVSGSGDADVNVSEEVTATVSGSGDLVLRGNPAKENIRVSGSGDIMKRY